MKSIYQCLILAGILLMIPLQGCQGLLEKKPLGELTSDNFFKMKHTHCGLPMRFTIYCVTGKYTSFPTSA